MMTRDEALALLKKHLKNKNLFKHCLAVEAVMQEVAQHLGQDADSWALAGLLHDIDYETTADDPCRHSLVGAEMLAEYDLPAEVIDAVRTHNDAHGLPRETLMAKALYAVDPLTGLIVAAALIRPEKKLDPVDVEFLQNRFAEKSFARGARRETIQACGELGLSLEEFMALGLAGMKKIKSELGI